MPRNCSHSVALRPQVAGDGQELGALEAWYGQAGRRTEEEPLLIGSVKSNMGHCEGCSGLAGNGKQGPVKLPVPLQEK